MKVRDILVQQTDERRRRERTALACAVAAGFEAHLTGLYSLGSPMDSYLAGSYMPTYVPPSWVDELREQTATRAEAAEQAFREQARREGVAAEWRAADGDDHANMALHGRYADLVIVSQGNPDGGGPNGYQLADELVLTSGRPVLILPDAGNFPALGSRVLVAWNSSREAARAVHDALPLLTREGTEVTVLTVNADETRHVPGADIAAHLARHGIRTDVKHTNSRDIDVGDVILNHVSDLGADLVVMGAYGHRRFREIVLGGATRHILGHMTAPVLMSH